MALMQSFGNTADTVHWLVRLNRSQMTQLGQAGLLWRVPAIYLRPADASRLSKEYLQAVKQDAATASKVDKPTKVQDAYLQVELYGRVATFERVKSGWFRVTLPRTDLLSKDPNHRWLKALALAFHKVLLPFDHIPAEYRRVSEFPSRDHIRYVFRRPCRVFGERTLLGDRQVVLPRVKWYVTETDIFRDASDTYEAREAARKAASPEALQALKEHFS